MAVHFYQLVEIFEVHIPVLNELSSSEVLEVVGAILDMEGECSLIKLSGDLDVFVPNRDEVWDRIESFAHPQGLVSLTSYG